MPAHRLKKWDWGCYSSVIVFSLLTMPAYRLKKWDNSDHSIGELTMPAHQLRRWDIPDGCMPYGQSADQCLLDGL